MRRCCPPLGGPVRAWIGVGLLLLAGACRGTTSPDQFVGRRYAGTWDLIVQASPGCWDKFMIEFGVQPEDAERDRDDVFSFSSPGGWVRVPSSERHGVRGTVSRRDSLFSILFLLPTLDRSGHFAGSVFSHHRMDGEFVDPSGAFRQLGAAPGWHNPSSFLLAVLRGPAGDEP